MGGNVPREPAHAGGADTGTPAASALDGLAGPSPNLLGFDRLLRRLLRVEADDRVREADRTGIPPIARDGQSRRGGSNPDPFITRAMRDVVLGCGLQRGSAISRGSVDAPDTRGFAGVLGRNGGSWPNLAAGYTPNTAAQADSTSPRLSSASPLRTLVRRTVEDLFKHRDRVNGRIITVTGKLRAHPDVKAVALSDRALDG
jgi:hypothetical protein